MRRRSRPRGSAARLYRRLRFGDLAEISLLDTRQYRDDQPCDTNGVGRGQVVVGCPERLDPGRSLLGTGQRCWLLAGLDRSHARWNVLAQQLLMAELELQPGPGLAYGSDGWDGYAADRARILRFLEARRPSNPVVLGGDMHSFWVNDLHLDNHRPGATVLASEFVGTSISSSGPLYELYRGLFGRQPPCPVLREPLARLPPLPGGPPTLEDRPAGRRHRPATRRAGPDAGQLRGRGRAARPPGRLSDVQLACLVAPLVFEHTFVYPIGRGDLGRGRPGLLSADRRAAAAVRGTPRRRPGHHPGVRYPYRTLCAG